MVIAPRYGPSRREATPGFSLVSDQDFSTSQTDVSSAASDGRRPFPKTLATMSSSHLDIGRRSEGPPRADPSDAPAVLILEEDHELGQALCFSLALEGFRLETFDEARPFLTRAASAPFDAAILGHAPPTIDALDVAAKVRDQTPDAPLLVTATNPTGLVRRQIRQLRLVLVEKPLLGDALAEALKARLAP